ncbi:MAG: LytTR family DNA-binding domain-containing protein [Sphingobacterium sp.]|jgi:DNA-binding LytR/AlgR family response regulator|uniref:LytR/AlgR family response regulator transcription factor n=1 Tax=Sphingobacterium sp. TaxID=341027 RepID=UPI002838F7AA|nr:LytTR family DNA-binding domain-containing protein [Sphingobacterium sp.]MDR0262769.1 LytTR family DNA-binding domain-containing protein [Sphingobacterium sp.]
MKILIIEDELPSARFLQRKLAALGYTVSAVLQTVEESIEWFLSNTEPDLLFMDIQLADGISFDILEQIKPNSAIIFTTAFDEYLLRAFKQNSIDYLLKPIEDEELENAIEKFIQYRRPSAQLDLASLEALFKHTVQTYKERFTIKIGQSLKVITTQQIECFYSENKGTYLYSNENGNYLLDQTLDALTPQLSPKDFFRINRSTIVQFDAIKNIAIHSNARLKIYLKHYESDELIVSREKVAAFRNWLDK